MEFTGVVIIIVVALAFDYTNGFHDAANAIATSVSTRALTPRVALLMAAVFNFVGAFLGTEVAEDRGQRHHRGPFRIGRPAAGLRRPRRGDRLEPDDLAAWTAVVVVACAHRRPRRRGARVGGVGAVVWGSR